MTLQRDAGRRRAAARADAGAHGVRTPPSGRATMRASVDDLLARARRRFTRLEPAAAHAAARSGAATLIDVRTDAQRTAGGVVPGALVFSLNVLEWRLDPDSPSRAPGAPGLSDQIILLCQDGYCTSLAAARLLDLGFTRATDVMGGFVAWRHAGLPVAAVATPHDVERGAGPATSWPRRD